MKNIFSILMILIGITAVAQTDTDTIPKQKQAITKENIRLYYFIPDGVGDNVLAKANEGKFGVGLSLSLFSVDAFHFGAGFEFSQYDITNAALAGNFKNTNINHLFAEVMYKLPIGNKISINPKIAAGYVSVRQKTSGESFGLQEGHAFTLGYNVDYVLTGRLRVFAGMNFSMLRPKVNTADEEKDFYHKLNTLNIVIGLKI